MFVLQIQGLTGIYEKGPYEKGYYHGLLIFPTDYPVKPPEIRMLTPSGRFEVNTPLCTQFSSFHPWKWRPSWTIAYILKGLANFIDISLI